MSRRVTLTFLGQPHSLTLPIPNIGVLVKDVPHELTPRILARFPDEAAEAVAHRLAGIYNRGTHHPRIRVDVTDTPVDPPPPTLEPNPDPDPEPEPEPLDDSSPDSQE